MSSQPQVTVSGQNTVGHDVRDRASSGLTALTPGTQVSKADERVAAMGGVEALISSLGLVRSANTCPVFDAKLVRIQKALTTMVRGLADTRSGKYLFSDEESDELASDTQKMRDRLLTSGDDVLPGGSEKTARLFCARTDCRSAERAVIAMDRRYAVPDLFKKYLNYLGTWLDVAARLSAQDEAKADEGKPTPATAPMSAPSATGDPVSEVMQRVLERLGQPYMTLERATRLITSLEQVAREKGRAAVFAVCNAEGNPVAVHVMDGAYLVSFEVAVKKAYTATAVRMSTQELSKLTVPGGTFYGLSQIDKIITFGGGIPLTKNGVIIGGLGVSGGTGDEDHELAQIGAALFSEL